MVSLHSRANLENKDYEVVILEDAPAVLEGKQELETLLPVSKLTGRREDPLMLLKMQFSKDSRLLDALLQELPVVKSDPNISDDDRFSVLASRLSTGTPYENEQLVKQLASLADVLFPEQVKESEKIVFDAAKDAGVAQDAASE